MSDHRVVLQAFADLPEIMDLPAWSECGAWYREHGFDIEQLRVDSLACWVPGMADAPAGRPARAPLLTGLFGLVESLISLGRPGGLASVVEGLIEHRIFRAGREGETAGIVVPATQSYLPSFTRSGDLGRIDRRLVVTDQDRHVFAQGDVGAEGG